MEKTFSVPSSMVHVHIVRWLTNLIYACCHISFSFWLLSVLHGHSVFSSPAQRPMTFDFEGFLFQMLSITFLSHLNFLRKSQYFPFQCCVLNKGTTGTIFITSLSWRGPWLGIEPGPSHTRSQHYTTRLSRWQCLLSLNVNFIVILRTFYSFLKAGVIIFTKHVS